MALIALVVGWPKQMSVDLDKRKNDGREGRLSMEAKYHLRQVHIYRSDNIVVA